MEAPRPSLLSSPHVLPSLVHSPVLRVINCLLAVSLPLHGQVTPGGVAAQAGLQEGDVVLEVNGCAVTDNNDMEILDLLLEAKPPLALKLAAGPGQDSKVRVAPEAEVRKLMQRCHEGLGESAVGSALSFTCTDLGSVIPAPLIELE